MSVGVGISCFRADFLPVMAGVPSILATAGVPSIRRTKVVEGFTLLDEAIKRFAAELVAVGFPIGVPFVPVREGWEPLVLGLTIGAVGGLFALADALGFAWYIANKALFSRKVIPLTVFSNCFMIET